jgi:capsular exopolysaccharide synthesis family protein
VTVAVTTLLALLAGTGFVLTAPVTYTSSAGVFFSLTAGSSAADLVQGSTYAQNEVSSFARLATTPAVLQPVIDRLALATTPQELAGEVRATVPTGTVIVEVTVTDTNAARSAVVADEVVSTLSWQVERLAPADTAGAATVRATTVAPAVVPTSPSSPRVLLDLLAALVLGLVLGYGVAWLREALDTRVRDAGELAEVTGLPLIGAVGSWSQQERGAPVVAADPRSPQAESYRQLRTNLQFLWTAADTAAGPQVLAVTSALPGEGKSATACNLALALAETRASVVLVDADLRRPAVAERLGLEGGVGLTTVLAGDARLEDVLQPWGSGGLSVLPSGAVPPNPAELIGSPAMRLLLDRLRATHDYVVLDTTPVLPVADATILSRLVDGTVVVSQAGRVRRGQLLEALGNLSQVSADVLGVVLNRVRRDERSYGYRAYAAGPADATGRGATGEDLAARAVTGAGRR